MDFFNAAVQEKIALLTVAVFAVASIRRVYLKWIGPLLAAALLKRGRVSWAMRVRASYDKPARRLPNQPDNDCKC